MALDKKKQLDKLAKLLKNCKSKSEYRRLMIQLDEILDIGPEDVDEYDGTTWEATYQDKRSSRRSP